MAGDREEAQTGSMIDQATCHTARERRDRSFDGKFYIGVVTTGIYCKPSCPSRMALAKNVRFYETPDDAERDGLRPCLRCRPREEAAPMAKMRELCRFIEKHAEERLDLAALAARAGLSRFHLQRSFKAAVGVTPKEYAEACRMRRLKESLRTSRDVTEAVYEAGFGSSSQVYERAATRLGMTPKQYREGARDVGITYAAAKTSLGTMMIGATDRGICFLQFGESEEELTAALRKEYPRAELQAMGAPAGEFLRWIQTIEERLNGTPVARELPLDIRATAFQMRVWNYLLSIPAGEVQSYGEVAKAIGEPSAVRAVARACAANRVALLIPCHRVIRGTGEMGGYRWGLARKRALLDAERSGCAT
jgi:AraC family transcriptional regulator of adaptative response/methylated-DNA-[protein]-cysteine methyltransferase